MNADKRHELYIRFDRLTKIPMLLLAAAMVPLILVPVLFSLPANVEEAFIQLELFIWAAFATELVVKTYLADSRTRHLKENWIDVFIVLVPVLRPLRLLRLLRLAIFMARILVGLRRLFVSHGLAYSLTVAGLVVVVSAVLMFVVERDSAGTIKDFPDALWWAVTTVTTVGYGDKYPLTPEGRAIATVLMLVGIALFGVLTASLAAFFVEGNRDNELHDKVDEILSRMDRLESRDP